MVFIEANVSFDVDLLYATQRHLDFLNQVNATSLLNNVKVLDRAIYRYEYYWLPLAAEHRREALTAPLDIQWVWHCHMLCPTSYVKDCMNIVGFVIDHRFVDNEKTALQRSRDLWFKKYRDTYEPFEIDLNKCSIDGRENNEKSRISYDIKKAASRQVLFYYSVSLPHYRDPQFLWNSLLRYKKFLYLRQQNSDLFLVPSYDIDLIWHTHQLYPLEYKNDTEALFGQLFNHDDTANDRTPKSKRTLADLATRELWENTFNEPFAEYGTMYRGDSPRASLHKLTSSDVYKMSAKKASIQLIQCVVHTLPERYKHLKLNICCSREIMRRSKIKLRARKDPLGIILTEANGTQTGNQMVWPQIHFKRLDINTRHIHNLLISLSKKSSTALCGGVEHDVGDVGIYSLLPLVEGPQTASAIYFESNIDLSHELSVSLKGTVAPSTSGMAIFTLESGLYKEACISEHLQHLWGPIKLAHLPGGFDSRCQVADHRLRNHADQAIITCRITHSLPFLMSVVQVFYHDKMVAVAHLIGPDQLPLPLQLHQNISAKT